MLRSEALTRTGNISTALTGSLRLYSTLQTSEAGAVLPLGMQKSLLDFMLVGM